MGSPLRSRLPRPLGVARGPVPISLPPASRQECLEQILRAFLDIADLDDIHQAALRLDLVQRWIASEAARAAADPLFADLSLCELPQQDARPKFQPSSAA
jgi:hypothetical protein